MTTAGDANNDNDDDGVQLTAFLRPQGRIQYKVKNHVLRCIERWDDYRQILLYGSTPPHSLIGELSAFRGS